MEYYEIVGLVLVALIAIASFLYSIKKNTKEDMLPLEELNINITKLNSNFEYMLKIDEVRDKRINKHGKEIDEIVERQRDNEKKLDNHEYRLTTLEKKTN